jgi:hypothetical protein
MIKEPIHIPPFVGCTECDNLLTVDDQITLDYFLGKPSICNKCKRELDWWLVIQKAIRDNFMFNQALSAIGANSIAFHVPLVPNQMTVVRFKDYGIPDNARILYINYTPYTGGGNGALFPLEVHSNIPYRHSIPNEIQLYPMPLGKGEPGKDTGTSILATW